MLTRFPLPFFCFLVGAGGGLYGQEAGPREPSAPLIRAVEEGGEEVRTLRVEALIEAGVSPGRSVVRTNAWAPVSVTLANSGIEVDGRAEITFQHRTRSPDDRRYRRTYRFPVSLPRWIKGQDPPTKRYTIPVFFEEEDGELWVDLVTAGTGWLQRGTRLELGRTPIGMVGWDEQLLLAVSDRPGTHNHLALSEADLPHRRVLDCSPDRLPDTWATYSGVDAVVLDALGLDEIGPAALRALMEYAASGGRVIVCGGRTGAVLRQDPWRGILPVSVTGLVTLSSAPILANRFGSGEALPGDLVVSAAEAGRGEVVLAEAEFPLIARANIGMGSVYFVAFGLGDPVIRDWPGYKALAGFLVAPDRAASLLERPSADAERLIESALLAGQLMDLPPRALVGLSLLFYLGTAVPLNFFLLWRLRRRELAWLTLPLLAAAFSAGVFTYNRVTRTQRMNISGLTLCETASASSQARIRSFWSVYSPGRTSLAAWFGDARVLPSEPLAGTVAPGLDPEPIDLAWDHGFPICQLPIRHQSNRLFASTGICSLAGSVVADLAYDGREVTGEIENRTPIDLERCWLMAAESGIPLGHIGVGQRVSIRMHPEARPRPVDPHSLEFVIPPRSADGGIPSEEARRIWQIGFPMLSRKAGLYLVGFAGRSPVRPVTAAGAAVASDGALFSVSLPVRLAKGVLLTLQEPFVVGEACSGDLALTAQAEPFPVSLYAGERVTFALQASGVDFSEARLIGFECSVRCDASVPRPTSYSWVVERPGPDVSVVKTCLYNRRFRRWDEVPAVNQTARPDNWVDYVDGHSPEILIRVTVEEPESSTAKCLIHKAEGGFVFRGGDEGV